MMRAFTGADMGVLNRWRKAHGLTPCGSDTLPPCGLITGSAIGFLRVAEGGVGILDSFVTSPDASSQDRHLDLTVITSALLTKAKERGLSTIIGWSHDPGILNRITAHGFTPTTETLFVKR